MSQTYNLGKVSLTPRGTFNSSTQYERLDVFTHNGSGYIVLQSVIGVEPPNPSYYQVIAAKGDSGESGTSAYVTSGTITMLPVGSSPTVTNSGTTGSAIFDFGIPYSPSYIADGSITHAKLAEDSVGSQNIQNGNITSEKIDADAIEDRHIKTGAVTESKIESSSVTVPKLGDDVLDLFDEKANIDGSYEGMTVGNAEQLVSSVYTEDSVPYTFRTTGGSADVGNRESDTVVGGTVAWNQLLYVPNGSKTDRGVTATQNASTGLITLRNTATGSYAGVFMNVPTVKDHVYAAVYRTVTNPNNVPIRVSIANIAWSSYRDMCKADATVASASVMISGFTSGTDLTGVTMYANIVDLTQMFGSTIADYLYTLDRGTAGAGIAKLKSWGFFTKDYYPYHAASLESVNVSAHRMVGFNAFDYSTGKAKVVGGNAYQITGAHTALSLYGTSITPDANGYFTPFASGELTVAGGDSTSTCVHLVWDGEKDGEYEEYKLRNYPLDSSLTLRGIPKLDSSNNLYYDGDEYESDGTVTRYWGERPYQAGDATDGSTMITDGTITVYKLATPTTESADPYANPQVCDDFGTEEYIDAAYTNGNRDFPMPCGHNTEYQNNLRAKLEMSPNSPNGDGLYAVRQVSGENSYEQISIPTGLPIAPSANGTYVLKCIVSGGTATYSWVAE